MATNPRIPDSGGPINRPTGGMRPEKPKSGVSGTAWALIVGALLLAAIIYFMPRSPKAGVSNKPGAEVPQQPTNGQVQLEGLKIVSSPTSSSLNLQGLMSNHGQQVINGLNMDVIFHGDNGAVVHSERVKVVGLQPQESHFNEVDLTQDPLRPGDTRPFRITVDRVPQGWNHQMPEVKIALVTSHP
ncbi:MAG: hypothetical protein ACM3JB_12885 [Acidobacteriaceae bacterium]